MKGTTLIAMKQLSIFLLLAFLFTACGDNESIDDTDARNMMEIEEYLAANNFEAEMTASGLFYEIVTPGGSERPTINTTVNVDYAGRTIEDELFDAGTDVTFGLSQVITGWGEGLQLIGRGGEINLYIPASLGYGQNPPAGSPIRAGQVIIFNVTLNNF